MPQLRYNPDAPANRRRAAVAVSWHRRGRFCRISLSSLFLLLVVGCTATHHREAADRQVYGILDDKAAAVPGFTSGFRLPAKMKMDSADLTPSASNREAAVLSLAEAITRAAAHNREFISRREDVYLEALSLTSERHQWSPRFRALASALWAHENDEEYLAADSELGVKWALASGAELGVSLSTDFLRFLSGDPRQTLGSVIGVTLQQPLWRGAGYRIARENLTQAERNLIYELRDFVRYRRSFMVLVASDYYRILQQRDVVHNEQVNLENLTRSRERAEMLGDAGRLPGFQVDQARQDELRARDRWVRAVQNYETWCDSFKIRLGLSTDIELNLATDELENLRTTGIIAPAFTRDTAMAMALQARLDLITAQDRQDDAARRIEIAARNLGPDLNIVLSTATGTQPPTQALKFSDEQRRFNAGVDLDLPLDRLDERNAYRSRLIEHDRRQRDRELLHDQVIQQIRDGWRSLEEARTSYEIQQQSVRLAEQRVESTTMLIDAGRADMRDQLEAREAQLEARNQLVATLVDYRLAMLALWRDMEKLKFDGEQIIGELE